MNAWLTPSNWNQRHRILAVCIGAYFGVRFCQVIIGSVVPGIIATFEVSRGTVGLTLTGMWVVYALAQIPSGIFADRFGERTVVIAALAVTAVATLGLAVAPTFGAFGIAVASIGVGAGIYYNPATTLLDRTAGAVGRAIGTHRVGGQIAGIAAPAGAAVVGLQYGWRETVVLGSVCVAIVAVAFVRGTRPVEPRRQSISFRELADSGLLLTLLHRPHTRTTTFMMALVEFAGLAAMSFFPTLLIEKHGFETGVANMLFAAFFAIAAVSQPLAGWVSDRHGRDETIVVLAGAGALGYGGLAAGGPIYIVGSAIVLAGVSMSGTPVIQSRMLEGLETDERGAGFGVFRTVYLLFGATSTAVVGAIADNAGWVAGFGLLSVLFVAVLSVTIAIGPSDLS